MNLARAGERAFTSTDLAERSVHRRGVEAVICKM